MRLRRGVMVVPSLAAMAGLLGVSVLATHGCGGSSKPGNEGTPHVSSMASACISDKACKSGENVCDLRYNICVACKSNDDCTATQVCIDTECVEAAECSSSKECLDENKPICDADRCVECAGDGDCGGGQLCVNNRCRASCAEATEDTDCVDTTTYCDTDGHAGACMPCKCDGNETKCLDDKTLVRCEPNGSRFRTQACSNRCTETADGAHCDGEETPTPDAGAGGQGAGGSSGTGGGGAEGGSSGAGGNAAGGSPGAGGAEPLEAGAGGAAGSIRDAAPEGPSCPPDQVLTGGDPCTSIPAFRGNQVVDGIGDEFCDIPAKTFGTQNAAVVNPSGATDAVSQATIRLGWSPNALHAFVHVASASVYQSSGELYDGDNVQFFIAGSKPTNGTVNGTDNGGANQIFIAPPVGSAATKAKVAHGTPNYQYAARAVEGGYDVEIKWPWATSGMTAGKQIAFDLMIGVSNPEAGGRKLEYLFYRGAVTGSCSEAYCDATLWCTPTLQ